MSKLKEVNFDKESVLELLGTSAFQNCVKLETLNLPSKILSMGEDVLSGCESLRGTVYEGAEYIGGTTNPHFILVKGVEGAKNCKVGAGCQAIFANAFKNNTTLETITFESDENLTSIGDYAFKDATSLKNITIPKTCQKIGKEAFYQCASLEKVTFAKENDMKLIGEYAFLGCVSLQAVENFEACNIPTLPKQIFLDCRSLKSIIIPNTVTSIENWALGLLDEEHFNEGSLESVIFEQGSQLYQMGQHCFRNQYKLKQIIIPESVEILGNLMFISSGKVNSPNGTVIYVERERIPDDYRVGWNTFSYIDSKDPSTYVNCPTYVYSKTYKEGGWHYVNGVPTLW